jgi:ribosomal protein S13
MDWDKTSNLYRGPSIDASYQVNGQQTTDNGRQVMAKAHIAFDKVS